MTSAEGPGGRDAGGAPGISPLTRGAAEGDARGGVAYLEQRAGDHLALRGDEGEAAAALLGNSERSDRAMGDVEFDGDAPAALPVVDAEAAQQGALLADRQVRRTIVAHLDNIVAEVQRLQLGERAAAAEPVGDQHRQRGAQLVFACGGNAAGGQQRGAKNRARAEALVLLALQAAMVIGEAVEGEVVGESVQADRDLRRPGDGSL